MAEIIISLLIIGIVVVFTVSRWRASDHKREAWLGLWTGRLK